MDKIKRKIVLLTIPFLIGCATNSNTAANSNVLIETTSQGVSIGTKDRKVKLIVPSNNLKPVNERGGGGQKNPNYFYFVDTKVAGIGVDLHFSGWLLPVEKYNYNEVGEFWATNTNWEKYFNHEFRKTGNWEVYLYDAPVPETFTDVFSSHMRANLLFDDTWVDLHLSITDMKPSKFLHDVLFDYLKTIQIIK
jgi:hypothetical protein